MEIVFILVPVSLLIVCIAVWAFIWSVRNDQYHDLEKEAHRILMEDELALPTETPNTTQAAHIEGQGR